MLLLRAQLAHDCRRQELVSGGLPMKVSRPTIICRSMHQKLAVTVTLPTLVLFENLLLGAQARLVPA